MKKLLSILLIAMTIKGHSQCPADCKKYSDSLYHTLDSVVTKPAKITTSNQTIVIDTLTIENNSSHTFQVILETNYDYAEKRVQLSNVTGTYTIISNKDIASLSRSMFSSGPSWNVRILNNKVIVEVTGKKNTNISWVLSKTIIGK